MESAEEKCAHCGMTINPSAFVWQMGMKFCSSEHAYEFKRRRTGTERHCE